MAVFPIPIPMGGAAIFFAQVQPDRSYTHVPFGVAVALLEDFWGVKLSRESGRHLTEQAGKAYVAYQTAQVEQIEQELPPSEEVLEHVQLSADGALVKGEWAKVKTVAIGAVKSRCNSEGSVQAHCQNLRDFPHAVQRLAQVAEAVWGAGSLQGRSWYCEKLHYPKHKGANQLLSELDQLHQAQPDLSELSENLNYFI